MSDAGSHTLKQVRVVRSFDIFDTLIARTVTHPTDVFDIVERAGVIGFKERRLQAQELSDHTWDDIYKNYQLLSGIDDSEVVRLKALELQAEKSVSYLVAEIYHQVRDGDILVSDMYLPREAIESLLSSIGFDKRVEIYVSPAGKASGQIWSVLKQRVEIECHVGDNLHSDVESPARNGISSRHFLSTQAAPMEALLIGRGAIVTASLIKRARLTNPYAPETREFRLHDSQTIANFPFLLLMAYHLRRITTLEGLSRVLFTTRDCCLLQPIYEMLFPDASCYTFHSSRIALTERRPSYVEYVRQLYIPGDSLIFDLHGAFKSGRSLFRECFGVLPRVHIFSGAHDRAPGYSGLTFNVPQGSNVIEALNLDRRGPLITIDDNGRPVRAPLSQIALEVGAIYHTIAARFKEMLRPHLDTVRHELAACVDDVPWTDVHAHIQQTVGQNSEIPQTEFGEHQSLTEIMNEMRSDKGSTYACAHCYTYHYESLIQDLGTRENLSLFEIGLNRDNVDDIPSLRGWRKYLGVKAKLFGADVNPHFLKHNAPSEGIYIMVADQSDPESLVRCGLIDPLGFDMIIDDGSHMSSHQQITLRTLWPFLRPGGIYVIEDLHYQPFVEPIMGTRDLLRFWRDAVPACTPYLRPTDTTRILAEVTTVELHDSLSQLWGDEVKGAFGIIRKRIG